jgi:hypothetical protein
MDFGYGSFWMVSTTDEAKYMSTIVVLDWMILQNQHSLWKFHLPQMTARYFPIR